MDKSRSRKSVQQQQNRNINDNRLMKKFPRMRPSYNERNIDIFDKIQPLCLYLKKHPVITFTIQKKSLSIPMTTMFALLYCISNKGGVLMSSSQFPDVPLSF